MFEKRDCEFCCRGVAGPETTGMAAGRLTITAAPLARCVTGGDLPRLPKTRSGALPCRGSAAVRPRERSPARGLLPERGGGGWRQTTGGTVPCRIRHVKSMSCADSQGLRGRLPRPRFTRDNGIYREQSCQDRPRARMRRSARKRRPEAAKAIYLVERTGALRPSRRHSDGQPRVPVNQSLLAITTSGIRTGAVREPSIPPLRCR